MITNQELIDIAIKTLNPRKTNDFCDVGGVACALVTDKNNVYTGVCIETPCSMGFCAEHNAIGNMITNGESNIDTIVAVGWDKKVMSPCGRCREFIYQISPYNKKTKVVLQNKILTIADLLPESWLKI